MGSKPPKAKKIMLDFDECFYFVIITSQVQKRVSDAGETGQEVPVCSGHKHPGRVCVQLNGFPVEQEEAQPVWYVRASPCSSS